MSIPFDESRRLTGANVYFEGSGAALEIVDSDISDAVMDAWREAILHARMQLGWTDGAIVTRRHASGVSLAFEAPEDQLFTATEINEWAVSVASAGVPSSEIQLPQFIVDMAESSADVSLVALIDAVRAQGMQAYWDDEFFTVGEGVHATSWPANELPAVEELDASLQRRIPKAVVTGSNGKTTVTRALAAIVSATGLSAGYCSTDGVVVDGTVVEDGDFSGPMGLRAVLRHNAVEVGILETARGGMLRRGLATRDADVAIVTNVSADHFGEYGIHSLEDLIQVKLLVHKALRPSGVLVANAGDDRLVQSVQHLEQVSKAWFALSYDDALAQGLPACGTRNGHLWLQTSDAEFDLGETRLMPITLGDLATYNIENLAAASLGAFLLGIEIDAITKALLSFGQSSNDNRGRLHHWHKDDVHVLLDYAHNPDGMQLLLNVARQLRGEGGRIAVLLEQAGNRTNTEISELAAVAASSASQVWLKEIGGDYQRGRRDGEVTGIMRNVLLDNGLETSQVTDVSGVEELLTSALAWAQPGDVLVLPVHAADELDVVIDRFSR